MAWFRQFAARVRARLAPLLNAEHSLGYRIIYGGKLMLVMLGYMFAALALYTLVLIPFTPGIADIRAAKVDRPAIVLSSDGKELTRFMRFNRAWKKLDEISPHVVNALIATEDHRFYTHHGIDVQRILSAVLHTLGGDTQGGSTLTQQLARNLFPKEIGRASKIGRAHV